MSNLSDLLPAGGGAKVITATADGNLATGQAVALQSNGTVTTIGPQGSAAGSEVVLNHLTLLPLVPSKIPQLTTLLIIDLL